MSIEKQEMDLIIREVEKRYKSDRAFYHGVILQRSWDRLKSDESKLWNVAVKSYQGMLDKLFSPYEQYLLKQARQHVQFNWSKTLEEAYNKLKMNHAKHMVKNGAQISVNSSFETYPADERKNPGTTLKVEDELGNYLTFFISVPSHQVPSGRENRKKWFEENFEKVVVL